jgi:hypothetical protein
MTRDCHCIGEYVRVAYEVETPVTSVTLDITIIQRAMKRIFAQNAFSGFRFSIGFFFSEVFIVWIPYI